MRSYGVPLGGSIVNIMSYTKNFSPTVFPNIDPDELYQGEIFKIIYDEDVLETSATRYAERFGSTPEHYVNFGWRRSTLVGTKVAWDSQRYLANRIDTGSCLDSLQLNYQFRTVHASILTLLHVASHYIERQKEEKAIYFPSTIGELLMLTIQDHRKIGVENERRQERLALERSLEISRISLTHATETSSDDEEMKRTCEMSSKKSTETDDIRSAKASDDIDDDDYFALL